MKKYICKITSLLLALSLFATLGGCNNSEEDDTSVIYQYEYITESGDSASSQNKDSASSSDKNVSSSNKNTNSNSKDTNKNNTSSTDRVTTTGRPKKEAEEEAKSRAKDLKGRTITYIAYWDAVSRQTEEGKAITQVEKLLNCKFEHRMLNDYKPLYTSILAGKPIADIYATMFDSALNTAANNMLTPLDTLSNFDFTAARWNQSSIKENTVNGHVYAVTSEPQTRQLLVYNKDMFKHNGWKDLYELQKNGKLTWDVLYDVMKKASELGNDQDKIYGLIPSGGLDGFAQTLVNANGVCALLRKGDTTQFTYGLNTKAGINALNTVNKWNSEGLLFNSDIYGWDSGKSFFYSGKGAMHVVDSISGVVENAEFEYGLVLFPHGPDTKKDLITYTVNAEAIPAGVKNPNDVALFWDLFQDLKYADLDFYADFYDAAPNESIQATIEAYQKGIQSGNYIHDWGNGWGVNLDDYYKQVVNGETSAASMVKSVEQKINGLIKDFLK